MSQLLSAEAIDTPAAPWPLPSGHRDGQAGQAPAPMTALIGREAELAAACRMFATDGIRLVTLTGPGGVGKTRLALAIAAALDETFAGSLAFVPLAPVRDSSLVVAVIAERLGIQESGAGHLAEEMRSTLQRRRTLLVLDNFEHVLAAAPLVGELLATCPELQVLVTSRRRLGLSGEHELSVPPLAVVDPRQAASVAELAVVPAIALFVVRAQAADPRFALTESNGQQVAEICQRLDGLPLAIELAAPRTRLLSPAALLSRLTNRLQLLSGGPRDAPERHQTMRQAIDWSYDLLDPDTRALLRRLAVFAGGFTLEAAEAVAPPAGAAGDEAEREPNAGSGVARHFPCDGASALERLAQLVDESLVQITSQPGDERRFGMLETVREYAMARLEATGEAAAARGRHAAYCLTLVKDVDPGQYLPEATVERFQTEHDNVRAALAWSLAHAPLTAMQLVIGFWRFWWQRGYWSEGRGWLERALMTAADAPPSLRAAMLAGAGSIAESQGDFTEARTSFEESLALALQCGDESRAAFSLRSLGIVASNQSEFERAGELFDEALRRMRLLPNQAGIARCLTDLGLIAERQGHPELAIAYYDEALPIPRAAGDATFAALLLSNLAAAVISTGDWERGEALSEEALAQSRAVGDRYGVAVNLHNLADRFRERDDLAGAWTRYRESLIITNELGERHLLSRILDRMAHLLTMSGLPRPAAHLLGAAAALRQAVGDTLFPSEGDSVAEAIAATRAALGEERFQAAWDVGTSLSLEQATAEALALELPPQIDEQRAARAAQLRLGLTARELEVLHLVAAGRSDKEIASALAISRNTASKHVAALRAKLDAPGRTGAVAAARAAGLL